MSAVSKVPVHCSETFARSTTLTFASCPSPFMGSGFASITHCGASTATKRRPEAVSTFATKPKQSSVPASCQV